MTTTPRPHHVRGALQVRRPDATVVPAILAGLSLGVPLLTLLATGHDDLLPLAAFGGFTGLYGRNEPYAVRARLLAAVGGWLVGAVALGAVTARGRARSGSGSS